MMSGQWLYFDENGAEFVGSAASLPMDNRGLAYGDGFFTTMAVSEGVIHHLQGHQQRLTSHAQALQLALDEATIERLSGQLMVQAQQLRHGMMKLIITRAPQALRGYGFAPTAQGSDWQAWLYRQSSASATIAPHLPTPLNRVSPSLHEQSSHPTSIPSSTFPPHASVDPIGVSDSAYMSLPDATKVLRQAPITAICLGAQIACLPPPLAGLKTLNRLDNVLASAELQRRKAEFALGRHTQASLLPSEGLVRDMSGSWVEGTMSNVFYQLAGAEYAGQWFTPPMDRSGVNGIMRGVIVLSFANSTHPIIERYLLDADLPRLERLFFCNALRGIMPVKQLLIDQNTKVQLSAISMFL